MSSQTDRPSMACFVCRKPLEDMRSTKEFNAHPCGAVTFSGGPPFGSRFDCDFQEIGLSGYKIFVCDDCWEERRGMALGFRKPHVVPVPLEYVGGATMLARFKDLETKLAKSQNSENDDE